MKIKVSDVLDVAQSVCPILAEPPAAATESESGRQLRHEEVRPVQSAAARWSTSEHCSSGELQYQSSGKTFGSFQRNAIGSELYEEVFYSLDLEERDYFGLQFTDQFNVQHWLDSCKKVVKQVAIGPPFTLRFRVKFFTSEPSSNLKEELTRYKKRMKYRKRLVSRYQFFLQIKTDIAAGRLQCPHPLGIELAAFALQCKY